MAAMRDLLFVVAGYLAGSLPFGYWVVRVLKGVDIRKVGSGSSGGSNVIRTYGAAYGIPVVLLDVAKGFAPAFVATLVAGDLAGVLAGGAAMLGHWRPLFLRFERGGKMVATCAGALFGVAPLVGLGGMVVWVVLFVALRYASVASMTAAATLPVIAVALGGSWPVIAFAGFAAVGVIFLHRANIRRLLAGTENRFVFRRRKRVTARA
jgi:acyl phosphate:glycerol-3-phosphate acyltransferase